MSKNYLRNQDDHISDPSVIAAKYLIGNNAYFEVSLALAELEELDSVRRGGGSASANAAPAVIGGEIGEVYDFPFRDDIVPGCPEKNEYIWVKGPDSLPIPVRAYELLSDFDDWDLYNPITRNFNALSKAELIAGVPLGTINSDNGVESVVSNTHVYIRNTSNKAGTRITRYEKSEIVRFDPTNTNIYIDGFACPEFNTTGEIVRIELEDEFIYATGHTIEAALLAHNFKLLS